MIFSVKFQPLNICEWNHCKIIDPLMKILLTGGSGFIGRHVLRKLLSENHEVIVPIRTGSHLPELAVNLHPIIVWGNFFDNSLLQQFASYHPEVIIHLASIRGEGQGRPEEYQRINVEGTEKLAAFAVTEEAKMFVYCSTVGVFGTIPQILPAGLPTPLAPDNNYHSSKYQAEQGIIRILNGKVPYCIVRPTITYGPGDNGFLPRLIQMVRKKTFPLIRTGIKIHLLQVETFAEVISRIINQKIMQDSTVILTDHTPVLLSEVVDTIYRHFYGKSYPSYLRLPYFFSASAKKIIKLLGMKSLYTSLQLISDSWYYDYGDLVQQYPVQLKDTLKEVKTYLQKEFPA